MSIENINDYPLTKYQSLILVGLVNELNKNFKERLNEVSISFNYLDDDLILSRDSEKFLSSIILTTDVLGYSFINKFNSRLKDELLFYNKGDTNLDFELIIKKFMR